MIGGIKRGDIGKPEWCRVAVVGCQCGAEIAGNAQVIGSIRAVGCEAYFVYDIGAEAKIFGSRHTYRGIVGQYEDAVVAMTQPQFIFSTNHTIGFFAADFPFFEGDGITGRGVERCTDSGDQHDLTGSDIRCTADNMEWLRLADVDSSDR